MAHCNLKQTTMDKFLKPKKIYSLQQLSMAVLPQDTPLLYGIEMFTKQCWFCDRRYFVDGADDESTNLCIKCRICKFCGQSTWTMRRKTVISKVFKHYITEKPSFRCTSCVNPWYRIREWCAQCDKKVLFTYRYNIYKFSDNTTSFDFKCADCIFKEFCHECGVKYTDLYQCHDNEIYNLEFTVTDDANQTRTLCEDCLSMHRLCST